MQHCFIFIRYEKGTLNGSIRSAFYLLCCFICLGKAIEVSGQKLEKDMWTLEDCILYAQENNIQIKLQEQALHEAGINLNKSKQEFYPALSGNAYQGYNFGRSVDPFTNQYTTESIRTNNFSLNLSYTLFDGFRRFYGLSQNKLAFQSLQANMDQVKRDLIIGVTVAYFQVLFYVELLRRNEAQLEMTIKKLEQADSLFKYGYLPSQALNELRATVAADKVKIAETKSLLGISFLNVKQILGLPLNGQFNVKEQNIDMNYFLDKYTNVNDGDLLSLQPEVKEGLMNVRIAELKLRSAQKGRSPKLGFNASLYTGYSSERQLYSYNTTYQQQVTGFLSSDKSQTVSSLVPRTETNVLNYPFEKQLGDNFSQILGFSLSIPVLSNGQIISEIAFARLNKKKAEYDLKLIKQNLVADYNRYLLEAESSLEKYKSSKEQVEALTEVLNTIEQKFNTGYVSGSEYYIANNNLMLANSRLLEYKYEYLSKIKILELFLNTP